MLFVLTMFTLGGRQCLFRAWTPAKTFWRNTWWMVLSGRLLHPRSQKPAAKDLLQSQPCDLSPYQLARVQQGSMSQCPRHQLRYCLMQSSMKARNSLSRPGIAVARLADSWAEARFRQGSSTIPGTLLPSRTRQRTDKSCHSGPRCG